MAINENDHITEQQAQIFRLLLTGHSWSTISSRTGVTREVMVAWTRGEQAFENGLRQVKKDLYDGYLLELETLRLEAIAVIRNMLRAGKPAERLRAAELVLTHSTPHPEPVHASHFSSQNGRAPAERASEQRVAINGNGFHRHYAHPVNGNGNGSNGNGAKGADSNGGGSKSILTYMNAPSK